MRYARVAVGGSAEWARVEGDTLALLSCSPLDAVPVVTGGTPLTGARWLPPVVPPVFYAVGMNYTRHIEHARQLGDPHAVLPTRAEVGYRANNALTGHLSPVIKPREVEGRFEAEGELVAVLGRTLRRATYEEARAAVFGWTIGNDVSAREWQHQDRTLWRSKNSDTFKPMGPWIETDLDPMAQTTTVSVDGRVHASFPTGGMVFDPYEYLVEITRHITVHPGDVLWMGTEATCPLVPGTTVDIGISGIGVLSSPVVDEEPGPQHPRGTSREAGQR